MQARPNARGLLGRRTRLVAASDGLALAPALEQARLVREGEVSPVELVEAYAGRIEVPDGRIGAYLTLCLDRALDEARAAQEAVARHDASLPPFHGVPISIKDLYDTAGVRTTYGSGAYADHVPAAPGPAHMLSQRGPIDRTVADAAALLDVMAGPAPGDPWWAPAPPRPFLADARAEDARGFRIAVTTTAIAPVDVAAANAEAVREAAALLESLGHSIREEAPPAGEDLLYRFPVLWAVTMASREPRPDLKLVEPLNGELIRMGDATSAPDYHQGHGGGFGALGVVLFVAPAWSAERFPWGVSDFVAMTIGGWCIGSAVLAWQAAHTWRWRSGPSTSRCCWGRWR